MALRGALVIYESARFARRTSARRKNKNELKTGKLIYVQIFCLSTAITSITTETLPPVLKIKVFIE